MEKFTPTDKEQDADAQEELSEPGTDEDSVSSDRTNDESSEKEKSFPIVGMGASAGGLEACEKFFANMPADSGMAFVLVPHLDPHHKSMMVELLQRSTKLEVCEIEDGMQVQPNRVYVIPPNKDMGIMHGALQLMEQAEPRGLSLPIDFFLRSLARDQKENAICIILSGTGASGTLGLKAIKGEGGLVMVQDLDSAKYDGMPRSAIDTGLADYVLPPEKMPGQLIHYVRQSHLRYAKEEIVTDGAVDSLQKIFMLLRSQTGNDFSLYKPNTIKRRIERRMVLHQISSIADYTRYLQQNTHEVEMLFKELLIGVTNFFRDPEAFDILKQKVVPNLVATNPPEHPIRIWVPGCSTGEEAYSIAMVIQEYMSGIERDFRCQIFATDIDSRAIEMARAGVYPESIAVDVSPERLKRFFSKIGNTYSIKTEIREMIVFAMQNVIKDPPFSKLNLISCRNLLIYLSADLQKKILPLFHYILRENGILFLGSSETIGSFIDLFSVVNSKWKFYRRNELPTSTQVMVEFPAASLIDTVSEKHGGKNIMEVRENRLPRNAERLLLENYAPPCVFINEKCDILYIHGRTGKYLEPASGEARLNLLDMAREGLRSRLRTAIRETFAQKTEVIYRDLQVKDNSGFQKINLILKPIKSPSAMKGLVMVVFEDVEHSKPLEEEIIPEPATAVDQRVVELEQELSYTKENLQTTIEELETSNEELKSTNEELQSTNEELQSTNEELETSKEELQSLNEELTTVNAELQSKVDELSESNNYIKNLLDNTQIATIFVDNNLCIKRFTPKATKIISLIETDVGRPINHIASSLMKENLIEDVSDVLDTLVYKEKEVQVEDGHWYLMRITPYRTTDNVIDGVVLTFVDIHQQKKSEQEIQAAREYAENIIATVREPLMILDDELRIISASRSFYRAFSVAPEDTEGKLIYELGNQQWDIPKLRELLEEIVPQNTFFEDFEVEHEFPNIGTRVMLLNARRIYQEDGKSQMILLAIEDVTEHR